MQTKILSLTRLDPNKDTFLVTWQLRLPKRLLQELNTHGTLVKNAASMRAIPTKKFLKHANYKRIHWGRNRPGMSATENLTGWRLAAAKVLHWGHGHYSRLTTQALAWLGVHKQNSNPYCEAHVYADVILTMSDAQITNFFNLRCSQEAETDFCYIAWLMLGDLLKEKGLWWSPSQKYPLEIPTMPDNPEKIHWPFGYDEALSMEENIHANVAAAARVSYLNHEGEFSPEKNKELHDRLIASGHMSPLEHIVWIHRCGRSRLGVGKVTYRQYIESNLPVKPPLNLLDLYERIKVHLTSKGYLTPAPPRSTL